MYRRYEHVARQITHSRAGSPWASSLSSSRTTPLLLRTPLKTKSVCDEWSVDDGQRSDSPALALGPQEPAGATSSARASSLPMLRGASAGPQALAAQLARRSSSGAAEARRPSRDKRRRRTRRHAKWSMWREIQRQDRRCRTMRACCEEASSDDDDHNTGDSLLLLCAHALVGSVLPSDMSEADELLVALGELGRAFGALAFSTGGRARASAWTCR